MHMAYISTESQLNFTAISSWTTNQENSISREYPFADLRKETLDEYVVRTYLQFLWLPESIMPLHLLVPSLERVKAVASSESFSYHPLHDLLGPLLLSTRSATNKYHVELPQILSNGGGAGEIEETMMWFSLDHEKVDEFDRTRAGHSDADEKWRTRWLDRLEQREVQIQILLHLLKLSLPGSSPPSTLGNPSSLKRWERSGRKPKAIPPSVEGHLESFMDKLSMWQLMSGLNLQDTHPIKSSVDRDWMQVFCENIVEPQFKARLPELCTLLRTKVFPNSPFSSDSTFSSSSRSPSPALQSTRIPVIALSRDGPELRDRMRHLSPAPLASTRHTQDGFQKPDPLRRSRSLSVSLAQEKEKERAGSVGTMKKRTLNREVSMSRVFKGKKGVAKEFEKRTSLIKRDETETANRIDSQGPRCIRVKDEGVTLVVATPVKTKAKLKGVSGCVPATANVSKLIFDAAIEEEEIWDLPSSPDILFLGTESTDADCSNGENAVFGSVFYDRQLSLQN